jgi:hypothetical protein
MEHLMARHFGAKPTDLREAGGVMTGRAKRPLSTITIAECSAPTAIIDSGLAAKPTFATST